MSRRRPLMPGPATNLRTLNMMIDYAILAGVELRSLLFVLLMRATRLEWMMRGDAY